MFVFPPNCPIPVYGRKKMPNVYGAIWVPRKVQRTNYSDWQAGSQLVFLTEDQELMCFVSDVDEDVLGASMAHLQGYQSLPQTPFGAMWAKQQIMQQQQGTLMNGGGALLLKKSSAKEVSGANYCVLWRDAGGLGFVVNGGIISRERGSSLKRIKRTDYKDEARSGLVYISMK